MDWNDLASRQLPSLSTSARAAAAPSASSSVFNNTNSRNLSQLHVAGQSLLQSSGTNARNTTTTTGAAAFGQNTMTGGATTQQWSSTAGSSNNTTTQQQQQMPRYVEGRVFESLQDAIDRHEQEITNSILSRTLAEVKDSTDARMEAQLQQAWEADRGVWAKSVVGTRYLGGAAAASTPKVGGGESSHQLRLLPQPSPYTTNWGSTSISNADASSSQLDLAMVRAHLEIVQQMVMPEDDSNNNRSSRSSSLQECIEKFALVSETANTNKNDNRYSSLLGYTSAWRLTQSLVSSSSSSSSLFASGGDPVQQAKAALSHFCHQFQIYIATTVRQAGQAGQDTSSSSTAFGTNNVLVAQCAAFAKLKLGLLMSTSTSNTDDPAWAVLYYCLRCGDAVAAAEVLPAISSSTTDPAVQRCLSAMAQAQGGAAGIWDATLATTLRLAAADRRAVADLLESAKRSETPNIHEMGVYAFLSGSSASQPVTSETVEGFKTIEDYLTGALWAAVMQQNPVDELIQLGKRMQDFGPSHFHDPSSGGWSFALPLLATQQYEKALMWLTEAGGKLGLLQATHIGLVLSSAGIAVRNLGANDSSVSDDRTVASLLVAYATELLAIPDAGALAALEYLCRIPNRVRSRKEVAKLIANTEEFDQLAGVLNDQGRREGGAIENRYSESEISSILVEAANILSAFKDDPAKKGFAVVSLMLAERYGDVLTMLNQLLSPPNNKGNDPARKNWIGQVELFHSRFLSKRTYVSVALEREKKTKLILTSRKLVDLNMFFDRLTHGGSVEECLAIAKKLHLLPTSASDRAKMEDEYKAMDPLIKESYPSFLVGVMEILRKDYIRLKRGLHGDPSGTVRQSLQELRERVRLYTSFAASVEMNNVGELTEMASYML